MSRASDHRAHAADCFRQSLEAGDPDTRKFYQSLAQMWLILADEQSRDPKPGSGNRHR